MIDEDRGGGRSAGRRGLAVVELAALLPLLLLVCLGTVDFARVNRAVVIVTNCARNGALYLSDPTSTSAKAFATVQEAALSDAANLSPKPTVSSSTGTDGLGNKYVEVTVSYDFRTLIKYPGIPNKVALVRKVRMAETPT